MYEHREENLVEAEALGRVGQDVGVNRVRGVRVQLAIGPSWVAKACMMQPNHANMDNLQCFNSLIFNSSKSPDSAKDNGSNRPPRETSRRRVRQRPGQPCQFCTPTPPTKMVSMIKTFQKDG